MYRKQKKLLSIVMSTLVISSSIFTSPMMVFATEKSEIYDGDSTQILQSVKEFYKNSTTKVEQLQDKFAKVYNLEQVVEQRKLLPGDTVRFIVELEDKTAKEYAKDKTLKEVAQDEALTEKVLTSQEAVKNEVKKIDSDIKIRHSYTLLLNGFSLEGKLGDKEKIEKLPGVKNVTVAKVYYPTMHKAKDITKTQEAWSYGYTGKGTAVAIIDTGMDPIHPDMRLSDPLTAKITDKNPQGGGKYFNEKIPYGYNYADGNLDIVDHRTASPGYQHGMHVGGTVGANTAGKEGINGVKGVAPETQLLAMKVFSNNPGIPGAFGDDQVMAIEGSIKHGADVLNMSLGGDADFQNAEDATAVALNRAIDGGVVPVLAAGNACTSTDPYKLPGVSDTGIVGGPGLTHESIQVASISNDIKIGALLTYKCGNSVQDIYYIPTDNHPALELAGKEYSLVDCGNGQEADYVGKDFSSGDKIALVKFGVPGVGSKVIRTLAMKKGAKAVIIYKEDDEAGSKMTKDLTIIPAAWVQGSKGKILKGKIATEGVKISFLKEKMKSDLENPNKGLMSEFTSWGPTPNLDFKPDITAPGGNIWSTGNTFEGGYLDMSGTSMATPHVAGGMALLTQRINEMMQKKEISFSNTRERIQFAKAIALNTAVPVFEKTSEGNVPYSPRRQGAGLMDNRAASQNNVTVTYEGEALVPLKEIENTKTFKLKLHNYGKKSITYGVKSLTDGILTDASDLENKFQQGIPYDKIIPDSKVAFDKSEVTVESGKDAFVTVTLTIPDKTTKNIFAEGFVRFVPKNVTEGQYIPEIGTSFMGFYGNWDEPVILDKPVWDKENTLLGYTSLINSDGDVLGTEEVAEGKIDVNPNKIAISNGQFGNHEAIPVYTQFRNAKEIIADIVDKDGNIVTPLSNDKNVQKQIFAEDKDGNHFKIEKEKQWDGKSYNVASGKREAVKDGQYYFRLRSKIDYPGAEFQEMKMPVKVDSIAPSVQIVSTLQAPGNKYKIQVKASDATSIEPSQIRGLVVAINGKVIEKQFPYAPKADGIQEIEVDVVGPVNAVSVVALDYAGNMGVGSTATEKAIAITSPDFKAAALESGTFTMKYKISNQFLSLIDNVKVYVDNKVIATVPVEKAKADYECKVTDLAAGVHSIKIEGLSAGKVINTTETSMTVQSSGFSVSLIKDLKDRLVTNQDTFVAKGSVTAIPDEFKINGIDVKVKANLTFETIIKVQPGKLNKVSVYAKKGTMVYDYAYNIYSDTVPAEVTMQSPVFDKGSTSKVVVVPQDTKDYTVKFNVKDDMFGYSVFINEEKIDSIDIYPLNPSKTEKNIEKTINLVADITPINIVVADNCGNITERTIKVIKDNPNSKVIDIKPIGFKDKYNNGDQINAGIEAKNTSSQAKDVTLIVGIYDENNQMVNVASAYQSIEAGKSSKLKVLLNIPKQGKYKVKCLVWDNFENMIPLSEMYVIE